MNEIVVFFSLSIFLAILLVIREIQHYKVVNDLLNRLMAKDYKEYAVIEKPVNSKRKTNNFLLKQMEDKTNIRG